MWNRRLILSALALSLAAAWFVPQLAQAQEPADAHLTAFDHYRANRPQGDPVGLTGVNSLMAPGTPGTLWDNGAFDGVNGLASQGIAFNGTPCTAGPGNLCAQVADDFIVNVASTLTEVRACFLTNATTQAEMWIYNNAGADPGDETAPAFGSTGPGRHTSIVTDTFNDNTGRCFGAFGFGGREFMFVDDLPTLQPEHYWLSVAAVPDDFLISGQSFWATSTNSPKPDPALPGKFGAGFPFGTTPWWTDATQAGSGRDYQFDIDGVAAGDGPQGDPVRPNDQLGGQVHLPILDFMGQQDACETWIEVQNIGNVFSKAALVTWGEPGFCPPQCAGPLKVECTGLLKPGSTWNFLGDQVPGGSKSGMLFSFTAAQLSEIGVDLGFDDVTADVMCETLFFGVVGDCDDYRRFKKAYNENLDFAGIPMRLAKGGFLAVDVLRHCDGDVTPNVLVAGKYNGIAGAHLGLYDPVFGGYAYYVPLLYAQQNNEWNSFMYIQNGGLECSSVEIWFKEQDDCLRARICEIFTLAPGETFQFDPNDCVGPNFQGSAWLRASQPLGIVVDLFGKDVLMTYIGEPAELNYTFNPREAFFSQGNQMAFGPLMYSEYQGWDSGVQVQNLSSVHAAKVKVYFIDRSGGIITTLIDWICPRGSQTFFLPVIANLPGNWVGSIRVESQEWWAPGDPQVLPPNIVGIATLIKYTDAARSDTAEAIAYNLLPEHKIFDWQIGLSGGDLISGVGLIAIPSLLKDLVGTGVTTELAITNVVPKPGFTDFAIYIFDQNGLLDFVCQKLNEKQVEYIDLETWGYINPGFKGSAVISATYWEHEVFDPTGRFLWNLVGLGAVVVERTGTRLGEDVPGDEAAGARGIPFQTTRNFSFDFEGHEPALCGPRFIPGPPVTEAFSASETLGTGTTGFPWGSPPTTRTLTVDAPADCLVTDVDLDMTMTVTWIGDHGPVTLASPGGTGTIFGQGFCGSASGSPWVVTFDDDSPNPLNNACTFPLTNGTFKTQSGTGLDAHDGGDASGDWTLSLTNQFQNAGEPAYLNAWGVSGTCDAPGGLIGIER